VLQDRLPRQQSVGSRRLAGVIRVHPPSLAPISRQSICLPSPHQLVVHVDYLNRAATGKQIVLPGGILARRGFASL